MMTDSEKYAAIMEDARVAEASGDPMRVKYAWERMQAFLIEQGDIEAPDPDLPDCAVEGEDGYVRVDK